MVYLKAESAAEIYSLSVLAKDRVTGNLKNTNNVNIVTNNNNTNITTNTVTIITSNFVTIITSNMLFVIVYFVIAVTVFTPSFRLFSKVPSSCK